MSETPLTQLETLAYKIRDGFRDDPHYDKADVLAELKPVFARLAAERDECLTALRAVLTEQPLPNGEYVHLLICSGSWRHPAGTRGVTCCCKVGRARYATSEAAHAALLSALREKVQEWRDCGASHPWSGFVAASNSCADELAALLPAEEP